MKNLIKSFAVIFVLGAGVVLYVLSHQIGGWRAFIVSSGSMEPAIATGSLIVTHYLPPSTLEKGDIITFIAPTKEREFVTHRINTIIQRNNLSIIKTKGDHNNNIDTWALAGGGVVGKEVISIPNLGYIFSFTQTKFGMLLFILIPSLYIIYSELGFVYQAFKRHPQPALESAAHAVIIVSMLVGAMFSFDTSMALLSGHVTLASNQFAVILPNATPVSGNNCSISITNTGAGSNNGVVCTSNNQTVISQNNNTSFTNTVLIQNNTGGNSSAGN